MHHIVQSYFQGVLPDLFKPLWVFGEYGAFGVDLFFVISGFIMANVSEKQSVKGMPFLINRVVRIYPNYWFYTLFFIAIFTIVDVSRSWNGESLINSLLLIPHARLDDGKFYPILYVGWTLTYEMFFYLIFSSLIFLKIQKREMVCAAIVLALAVLMRNNPFLGHKSILLAEFTLGILIYSILTSLKERKYSSGIAYVIFLMATFVMVLKM